MNQYPQLTRRDYSVTLNLETDKDALLEAIGFPVNKETLYTSRGTAAGEAITRSVRGTEVVLSTVSARYGYINHYDFLTPALEKLTDKGFKTARITSSNYGAKIVLDAQGEIVDIDGQGYQNRIIFQNSYDKTSAVSFFAGHYRQVCTNGMFDGVGLSVSRLAHTQNNVQVLAARMEALDAGQYCDTRYIRELHQLEDVAVPEYKARHLLTSGLHGKLGFNGAVDVMDSLSDGDRNRIQRMLIASRVGRGQAPRADNNISLWALYNGVTQVLTEEENKRPSVNRIQTNRTRLKGVTKALKAYHAENRPLIIPVS